jgi:predicted RNA-binding Zn ribbon-like protein
MGVTELELIRDFVNTYEVDGDVETLSDPRAREVREAIRTLLRAKNGDDVDSDAAAALLDRAARRLQVRFDPDARIEGRDAAGAVLAAVVVAQADGSWPRLKVCHAHDCLWAYVDSTRNQSRAWCSMRVCGNRAKVRAYRERHEE